MPGTGGSMNIVKPTIMKMPMTKSRSICKSSSLNHDRKTYVSFATPIDIVQYSIINRLTFVTILDHLHWGKPFTTLPMPSVNQPCDWVSPLIRLTFWFNMLHIMKAGIKPFSPMISIALTQSLVKSATKDLINLEERIVLVMTLDPTSM